MSMSPYANIVTTNNTATAFSLAQANIRAVHEQASCLQEHELTTAPFYMRIEDLVNLWLAKYGNEWVDVQEVMYDNYYKYVYARLKALGELEQHYLTDRSKFVCRKPD